MNSTLNDEVSERTSPGNLDEALLDATSSVNVERIP
jgi:hypothetical protein